MKNYSFLLNEIKFRKEFILESNKLNYDDYYFDYGFEISIDRDLNNLYVLLEKYVFRKNKRSYNYKFNDCKNKRIYEYKKENSQEINFYSIADLSRISGKNYQTLRSRILKHKWSINEAISKEIKNKNNKLFYKDNYYSMYELSKKFNINFQTLRCRLESGWSVKKSIEIPIRIKNKFK